MRSLRLALASTALAVFGLLGFSVSPVVAAYPNVECHITDPGVTCEGKPLRLTATVDPAQDCHPIAITWDGRTRTGTGSKLVASFSTKKGDHKRWLNHPSLRSDFVSCTYTDGSGTHKVTNSGSVIIKKCGKNDHNGDDDDDSDDDDDDNGHLPNTGGERLLWLILGALLVIGGGVTVASARKEDGEART